MRRAGLALALMGLTAGLAGVADAHEVRPALLQITERSMQRYDITWKQPVSGGLAVRLAPRLSGGALDATPDLNVNASYALKVWRGVSPGSAPLDGQTVSIVGLDRSIMDVLVSVSLSDGSSVQRVLTPRHPAIRLDLSPRAAPPVWDYLVLGVEHILTGFDHLLFVLGLFLLVGRSWALVRTITAFTVAHSSTLAATTLHWVQVRPPIIEALVALSIVMVGVERVHEQRGEAGLTSRYPWAIAFAFGLLHGCAFAGALAELGLPAEHVPLALFLFNAGVEIGQLLFIAGVSLGCIALGRLEALPAGWMRIAVSYAIGTFACYWFVERCALALSPGG